MSDMATGLLERVAKQRELHRALELVPGTGYHENDRNAFGQWLAPHKRHLPGGMNEGCRPLAKLSDHLLGFVEERRVILVGDDAETALRALQNYYERWKDQNPLDMTAEQCKLVRQIPGLAIEGGQLSLWRDTFNTFLHAFDEESVGISITPL